MSVQFSFNNPPLENIAFLMAKKPELHFDYDEIKFEAHQRAFTIAKITQIDLLSDIQTSLENAFVEGQSFEKWKKELKPTLQKHGWLGKVVVQNPSTKEQKEIFVGASRLKKIFYTNARTAYAQSEARAGYKLPLSEYIRYVAILDNRTRHTHAQMHGKIAHRKDKFWEKNYPPNGWNCRCAVEFISKDEMDEQGFKEMSEIEKTLNFAEKDWDYDTRNLEKNDNALQLIIENKLKRLAKNKSAVNALNALKAEIKAQRKRYNDMRALWNSEDLSKNVGLCKINNEFKRKIGAQTNIIKISAETIEAHKENSKYVPPKGVKKPNPHPEITAFDYSIIPFIIENKNKELYKDGEKTYIVASKMNVWYRLALKNLPDKKEIWVVSLMSRATKEELMPNLKNKKEIK